MERSQGTTLSADVTVDCLGPAGQVWQLEATLGYDPCDPFAVTLTFGTAQGPVPWTFARDLLDRGVTEPVGAGDVRLHPAIDAEGRAVVVIALHSEAEIFHARTRSRDVMDFLGRSYDLVPAEGESETLDVDALIADLFD